MPGILDQLVAAGLIDRIPDTPSLGGAKFHGIEYSANLPAEVYRLAFAYDIPGLGLGSIYCY
jgi:hypothetical protein